MTRIRNEIRRHRPCNCVLSHRISRELMFLEASTRDIRESIYNWTWRLSNPAGGIFFWYT